MLHGDLSSELTYENFCQRIVIHVAIHGDDVNTKWREPLPSLWALAHGKGTAAHVDKVKILQTSALYLFHIVNWVTSWLLRNLKMTVISTSSTAAHVEKVEILKTSALLQADIGEIWACLSYLRHAKARRRTCVWSKFHNRKTHGTHGHVYESLEIPHQWATSLVWKDMNESCHTHKWIVGGARGYGTHFSKRHLAAQIPM